jgi:hypothetical protein
MCFLWISEQTAIISLDSINWLVFITKTGCIYWAVRTEYLYILHKNMEHAKFLRMQKKEFGLVDGQ